MALPKPNSVKINGGTEFQIKQNWLYKQPKYTEYVAQAFAVAATRAQRLDCDSQLVDVEVEEERLKNSPEFNRSVTQKKKADIATRMKTLEALERDYTTGAKSASSSVSDKSEQDKAKKVEYGRLEKYGRKLGTVVVRDFIIEKKELISLTTFGRHVIDISDCHEPFTEARFASSGSQQVVQSTNPYGAMMPWPKDTKFTHRMILHTPKRFHGPLFLYATGEAMLNGWKDLIRLATLQGNAETSKLMQKVVVRLVHSQIRRGWKNIAHPVEESRRKVFLIRNFLGRLLNMQKQKGYYKWKDAWRGKLKMAAQIAAHRNAMIEKLSKKKTMKQAVPAEQRFAQAVINTQRTFRAWKARQMKAGLWKVASGADSAAGAAASSSRWATIRAGQKCPIQFDVPYIPDRSVIAEAELQKLMEQKKFAADHDAKHSVDQSHTHIDFPLQDSFLWSPHNLSRLQWGLTPATRADGFMDISEVSRHLSEHANFVLVNSISNIVKNVSPPPQPSTYGVKSTNTISHALSALGLGSFAPAPAADVIDVHAKDSTWFRINGPLVASVRGSDGNVIDMGKKSTRSSLLVNLLGIQNVPDHWKSTYVHVAMKDKHDLPVNDTSKVTHAVDGKNPTYEVPPNLGCLLELPADGMKSIVFTIWTSNPKSTNELDRYITGGRAEVQLTSSLYDVSKTSVLVESVKGVAPGMKIDFGSKLEVYGEDEKCATPESLDLASPRASLHPAEPVHLFVLDVVTATKVFKTEASKSFFGGTEKMSIEVRTRVQLLKNCCIQSGRNNHVCEFNSRSCWKKVFRCESPLCTSDEQGNANFGFKAVVELEGTDPGDVEIVPVVDWVLEVTLVDSLDQELGFFSINPYETDQATSTDKPVLTYNGTKAPKAFGLKRRLENAPKADTDMKIDTYCQRRNGYRGEVTNVTDHPQIFVGDVCIVRKEVPLVYPSKVEEFRKNFIPGDFNASKAKSIGWPLRDPANEDEHRRSGLTTAYDPSKARPVPSHIKNPCPFKFVMPASEFEFNQRRLAGNYQKLKEKNVKPGDLVTFLESRFDRLPHRILAVKQKKVPNGDRMKFAHVQTTEKGLNGGYLGAPFDVHISFVEPISDIGCSVYDASARNLLPDDVDPATASYEWSLLIQADSAAQMDQWCKMIVGMIREDYFNSKVRSGRLPVAVLKSLPSARISRSDIAAQRNSSARLAENIKKAKSGLSVTGKESVQGRVILTLVEGANLRPATSQSNAMVQGLSNMLRNHDFYGIVRVGKYSYMCGSAVLDSASNKYKWGTAKGADGEGLKDNIISLPPLKPADGPITLEIWDRYGAPSEEDDLVAPKGLFCGSVRFEQSVLADVSKAGKDMWLVLEGDGVMYGEIYVKSFFESPSTHRFKDADDFIANELQQLRIDLDPYNVPISYGIYNPNLVCFSGHLAPLEAANPSAKSSKTNILADVTPQATIVRPFQKWEWHRLQVRHVNSYSKQYQCYMSRSRTFWHELLEDIMMAKQNVNEENQPIDSRQLSPAFAYVQSDKGDASAKLLDSGASTLALQTSNLSRRGSTSFDQDKLLASSTYRSRNSTFVQMNEILSVEDDLKRNGKGADVTSLKATTTSPLKPLLRNMFPISSMVRKITHVDLLEIFVRHGVPADLRPMIWSDLSCTRVVRKDKDEAVSLQYNGGSMIRDESTPTYYQNLSVKSSQYDSDVLNQVDRDFKDIASLTATHTPALRMKAREDKKVLRRIIRSLVLYWDEGKKALAYDSSLIHVAQRVVMHFDEETTFWMMVYVAEFVLADYLTPKSVTVGGSPAFPPLMQDVLTVRAMLESDKSLLPIVHQLNRFNIPLESLVGPLLKDMFSTAFGWSELTFRVWDMVFWAASPGAEPNPTVMSKTAVRHILISVAFVIFKVHAEHFLAATNIRDFLHTWGNACKLFPLWLPFDADYLMEQVFQTKQTLFDNVTNRSTIEGRVNTYVGNLQQIFGDFKKQNVAVSTVLDMPVDSIPNVFVSFPVGVSTPLQQQQYLQDPRYFHLTRISLKQKLPFLHLKEYVVPAFLELARRFEPPTKGQIMIAIRGGENISLDVAKKETCSSFVKIKYGTFPAIDTQASSISLSPVWQQNQAMGQFSYSSGEEEIKLEIYAKGMVSHTLIGTVTVNLKEVSFEGQPLNKMFDVTPAPNTPNATDASFALGSMRLNVSVSSYIPSKRQGYNSKMEPGDMKLSLRERSRYGHPNPYEIPEVSLVNNFAQSVVESDMGEKMYQMSAHLSGDYWTCRNNNCKIVNHAVLPECPNCKAPNPRAVGRATTGAPVKKMTKIGFAHGLDIIQLQESLFSPVVPDWKNSAVNIVDAFKESGRDKVSLQDLLVALIAFSSATYQEKVELLFMVAAEFLPLSQEERVAEENRKRMSQQTTAVGPSGMQTSANALLGWRPPNKSGARVAKIENVKACLNSLYYRFLHYMSGNDVDTLVELAKNQCQAAPFVQSARYFKEGGKPEDGENVLDQLLYFMNYKRRDLNGSVVNLKDVTTKLFFDPASGEPNAAVKVLSSKVDPLAGQGARVLEVVVNRFGIRTKHQFNIEEKAGEQAKFVPSVTAPEDSLILDVRSGPNTSVTLPEFVAICNSMPLLPDFIRNFNTHPILSKSQVHPRAPTNIDVLVQQFEFSVDRTGKRSGGAWKTVTDIGFKVPNAANYARGMFDSTSESANARNYANQKDIVQQQAREAQMLNSTQMRLGDKDNKPAANAGSSSTMKYTHAYAESHKELVYVSDTFADIMDKVERALRQISKNMRAMYHGNTVNTSTSLLSRADFLDSLYFDDVNHEFTVQSLDSKIKDSDPQPADARLADLNMRFGINWLLVAQSPQNPVKLLLRPKVAPAEGKADDSEDKYSAWVLPTAEQIKSLIPPIGGTPEWLPARISIVNSDKSVVVTLTDDVIANQFPAKGKLTVPRNNVLADDERAEVTFVDKSQQSSTSLVGGVMSALGLGSPSSSESLADAKELDMILKDSTAGKSDEWICTRLNMERKKLSRSGSFTIEQVTRLRQQESQNKLGKEIKRQQSSTSVLKPAASGFLSQQTSVLK